MASSCRLAWFAVMRQLIKVDGERRMREVERSLDEPASKRNACAMCTKQIRKIMYENHNDVDYAPMPTAGLRCACCTRAACWVFCFCISYCTFHIPATLAPAFGRYTTTKMLPCGFSGLHQKFARAGECLGKLHAEN